MIAVIFEVEPAEGRRQDYLDLAAELRPLLEGIDGFLENLSYNVDRIVEALSG